MMVINQKFFGADSIFPIITTVVMVFVSIFTAGSAICIAWTQRKNGKRNHLNNLSVEFVTDFIQPLEEYEVSIKNKFEVLHDLDTDKERVKVMIGALGNINVHTEFLYWEQHKGDIENLGYEDRRCGYDPFPPGQPFHDGFLRQEIEVPVG